MAAFLLIAGALAVLAVLLSAAGGDTTPVTPVVSVVEEPTSSRVDLTVTVIMLVMMLLGVILFKITP